MLWLLLLLQVLASCLWLGHSEVVESFDRCPWFFYANTVPSADLNPQNATWICQRYNNVYRFATLYDRHRRIPVYSAYIYNPGSGQRPDDNWFLEPQLIGKNDLKEMEIEWDLIHGHKFTLDEIKESQAVLEDYEPLINYDRGHLSPSAHHDGQDNRTATFTLTNIVPQLSSLHQGQWEDYKTITMHKMNTGCTKTYVITGAVPDRNDPSKKRVNIPTHIWSAACCLAGKEPTKSWGVIAKNNQDEVENLSLGQLEDKLTVLYGGKRVSLFNNACPRE